MDLLLVLLSAWITSALAEDGSSSKFLSRKKRYIVFPEGSTFVSVAMTDVWVAVLVLWCILVTAAQGDDDGSKVLSRRKRYVVFPEGSTFAVAYCLTWKALTGESSIFTGGMAWSISYDLPNETISESDGPLLPAPEILRRHRRDIYRKVEVAMESVGLDGRACVLRAICETAQRLKPRSSLFQEIFRILFTLPPESVAPHEPGEHREYDSAHRSGLANHNCPDLYPSCPVSVLDNVLRGPQWDFG